MAQLLFEILSEEIPARMQARAQEDLLRLMQTALKKSGLAFKDIQTFSGPRRLTLYIGDMANETVPISEEQKGPRMDAPQVAIDGFLRKSGLECIEQAEIRNDKKGAFYIAKISQPGQAAGDILAQILPDIMAQFPWPKSMRSGDNAFRWVRPIRRILCLLDGEIIPFEAAGIKSADLTEGHRIMGKGSYHVNGFDDYRGWLEKDGHVILDREDRKARIKAQMDQICLENDLEWVEDIGLLEEVAGLAEWPVLLLGDMEPGFLDLPPEIIRLSMRTHQKYFAVRDKKTGKLAPHFLVVANLQAQDGGRKIAEGNARVLSARLNDARFFWDNDKKQGLPKLGEGLDRLVFHQRLGSMQEAQDRLVTLSGLIADHLGIDVQMSQAAAGLSKADLCSEMVGEFAELQGIMGGYYARLLEKPEAVSTAIARHYQPQGPNDQCPNEPIAIGLALADKLDRLAGFWLIDEKPTGSKDPYALRRAALGIIRLILENRLRLPLRQTIEWALKGYAGQAGIASQPDISESLLGFFADRLKVYIRETGRPFDLIDAVFALGEDDLHLILARMDALADFLAKPEGADLLSGYKRAANILRAEDKKTGERFDGSPDEGLFTQDEERNLYAALKQATMTVKPAIEKEDFISAMSALSLLRQPVDTFFESVIVNSDRADIRQNRLILLTSFRDIFDRIADFSMIEG